VNLLLEELIKVVDGKVLQQNQGEIAITGAVIDSRIAKKNDVFIPITGDHNDGHCFIKSAADQGCTVSLTEKEALIFPETMSIIKVASTFKALQAIAAYQREISQVMTIAITGSSGKTTTKDLIASVLGIKYAVYKTQGNYNNVYGVPLTLLSIKPEHEIAVVEMGMDHLHEIHTSIGLVNPHIAVITNIGTAHMEKLGSQENILKAKSEIFETMDAEDYVVLNADDPYLNTIQNTGFTTIQVGIKNPCSLRANHIAFDATGVNFEADRQQWHFKYPGIHNVYNCLVAIAIAKKLKMTPKEIQLGFDAFVPSGNRMTIVHCGNVEVLNDAYNANPESMKAAIDSLKHMAKQRKVAILGDMLELGNYSKKGHQQVGQYAATVVDLLIGIGDESYEMIEKAKEKKPDLPCFWFENMTIAAEQINPLLKTGDTILLKASNGMHLEKLIQIIQKGN